MLEKYLDNKRREKQEEKGYLEKIVNSFRGFARKVPVYIGIGSVLAGAYFGLGGCGKNEQYHAKPPTQIKQEQLQLEEQVSQLTITQEQSTELEEKVEEEQGYKGKIAFVSDRDGNSEIYIMNVDGSEQRRLTNNEVSDWNPQWSPDGSMIVFVSGRDGNDEIYVMNADGTEQRNLTNNPAWDRGGIFWSPDGKKIAFVSDRDGNNEIYVMNPNGSEQKRLTNNPLEDCYPQWSSDGKKIAFASVRKQKPFDESGFYEDLNYSKLKIIDRDGSNERELVHLAGDLAPEFKWFPDSKKIAFIDNDMFRYNGLSVVDIDSGNMKNIIDTNANNPLNLDYPVTWISDFCLSPDGERIAVVIFTEGEGNILYTMNKDGCDIRKITEYFSNDDYVSWSPDGSKIAFCDGNIKLVDIKSRRKRTLTREDYSYCPSWQPMPK